MNGFVLRFALIFAPALAMAHGSPQPRCFDLVINAAGPKGKEQYGVEVNGTVVTGNGQYPLQGVLRDLGVRPMDTVEWIEKRYRVLSVGEGISHLVPFLKKMGTDVVGLDLWYHSPVPLPNNLIGNAMREYQNAFGEFLVQGSVTQLPFADETQDIVLAHMLFNKLNHDDTLLGVKEIYRVLAPGGRAMMYGLGTSEMIFKIIETDPGCWPNVDVFEIDSDSMTITKKP